MPKNAEIIDSYFKLIHYPQENYNRSLNDEFIFVDARLPDDFGKIADVINQCYGYEYSTDDILEWTQYPVFDASLWVFIDDKNTGLPAALGIADYDSEIGEGSLEWIQVMPKYQGKGLGTIIVNELLRRITVKGAKFITVSGRVENHTNPEKLYRKCGFVGDDVWLVVKTDS